MISLNWGLKCSEFLFLGDQLLPFLLSQEVFLPTVTSHSLPMSLLEWVCLIQNRVLGNIKQMDFCVSGGREQGLSFHGNHFRNWSEKGCFVGNLGFAVKTVVAVKHCCPQSWSLPKQYLRTSLHRQWKSGGEVQVLTSGFTVSSGLVLLKSPFSLGGENNRLLTCPKFNLGFMKRGKMLMLTPPPTHTSQSKWCCCLNFYIVGTFWEECVCMLSVSHSSPPLREA